MLSLTWPGALAWRLGRHHLAPTGTGSTADVVGALGAVAAQLDPAASELGIRARREHSRAGDVRRALDEGTVVSTFAFRGAVHLMTPAQAAVHLPLRAASRMWERSSWRRHYGLEPDDWPDLRAVVREALADGPMTREELAGALAGHPRFGHLAAAVTDPSATLLKPFAWQGDVRLGRPREGRLTLQRLDANPHWTGSLDLEEAGPRAVEAYLRAYGPASADHLRYWLGEGLGVRRAVLARWVAGLGERLAHVAVDGEPRLVLREDLAELAAAEPTRTVHLLPRYDQWVLGPGTAEVHVVPPDLRPEVSRGADLVVVGGVVAGTWSLRDDVVDLSWSASLADAPPEGDLDAAVSRLGSLLDRTVRRVS